jgi:hypothetical protein
VSSPVGRFAGCLAAAATCVVAAQQAWVSAANFQGHDEWLGIELASRGVVGVPYANRPLVFLWQALAQRAWPDDLRAYWAFTSLAFLATGLLTGWLAHRLLPRAPLLALLAGVFAAAWAPLDWLRLDTTLIAGYAGFTAAAMLAVVLFVESASRSSRTLLLVAGAVALLAALGVEGVLPLLALAPLLLAGTARDPRSRRGRTWLAAWAAFVLAGGLFAAAPALLGVHSYQTDALRLDPAPQRVAARLVQLLGMQLAPVVASDPRELAHPAVPLAILGLSLGAALAWRCAPRATGFTRNRDAAVAVVAGLALACAGHFGLALAAGARDPSRSQLLSAPGFGLALAGAVAWSGSLFARAVARAKPSLRTQLARCWTLALALWIVAVGTGRVVAMQAEWDRARNAFPLQGRALADLVRLAPDLRPNTLVVLADGTRAGYWLTFTFRHAVSLMYSGKVIALLADGEPFAYPWFWTPEGVAVVPWVTIREPWGVRPTRHRWDEIVVARARAGGSLEICREWPADVLGPLPAGARYDPFDRIRAAEAPPSARRLLERLR